jgi:hypothetical protein
MKNSSSLLALLLLNLVGVSFSSMQQRGPALHHEDKAPAEHHCLEYFPSYAEWQAAKKRVPMDLFEVAKSETIPLQKRVASLMVEQRNVRKKDALLPKLKGCWDVHVADKAHPLIFVAGQEHSLPEYLLEAEAGLMCVFHEHEDGNDESKPALQLLTSPSLQALTALAWRTWDMHMQESVIPCFLQMPQDPHEGDRAAFYMIIPDASLLDILEGRYLIKKDVQTSRSVIYLPPLAKKSPFKLACLNALHRVYRKRSVGADDALPLASESAGWYATSAAERSDWIRRKKREYQKACAKPCKGFVQVCAILARI